MLKKPPQKVAYLSRIFVVSEIFPNNAQTAQMAEFMFQNVAYRATVHRTGVRTIADSSVKAVYELAKVLLGVFLLMS